MSICRGRPSLLRQLTHPPTHPPTTPTQAGIATIGLIAKVPTKTLLAIKVTNASSRLLSSCVPRLFSIPHPHSLTHSLTTAPQSPQGFSEAKVEKIKTIARKLCGGASGMSIFSTGVEVRTCMCRSVAPLIIPSHSPTTTHT